MKTFEEYRALIGGKSGNTVASRHFDYKYFPKTKKELVAAIEAEIEEQGNEADLNCINTSKITNMSELFEADKHDYAKGFNGDISNWNVSNVKNMRYMFYGCRKFNCNISKWDVTSATDMYSMFRGCNEFDQDLGDWDVSNVKDMSGMFHQCSKFNQDLSRWDVSKVADMYSMFRDCAKFNCDLGGWNVSSVTDMSNMFRGCESFDQDLSKWNVGNVSYNYVFKDCPIKEEHKPVMNDK